MDLAGRTVMVTGATGGIGRAIVAELGRAGATVVVHGRQRSLVEALAAEVGGRAVVADLADRAAVADLADGLADLDVIVLNAAQRGDAELTDLSVQDVDELIEVNLRAPIQLARGAAAAMTARGSGHIVLVTSLAAMGSGPRSEVYSATKAGLRLFGLGLREALAPSGVGVTLVTPGYVSDAGMFAREARPLPPGFATVTPEHVARSVRTGIERNRAEVVPASPGVRLAALGAHLFPGLAGRATRTRAFASVLPGGEEQDDQPRRRKGSRS